MVEFQAWEHQNTGDILRQESIPLKTNCLFHLLGHEEAFRLL